MRLAAIASALAIIICVAVVSVILSQSTSVAVPASAPKVVAPAARPPGPVITEIPAVPAAAAVSPADPAASAAAPAPNAPTTMAQATPRAPAPAPAPAAVPPPPPPHAAAPAPVSCPGNPNALGVARTVEIDTTGGPGFGFEHFKSHDFLREGEVVLTFDDGPWPKNTVAVLNALAAHCTKAIFFPIGTHATYEPGILKQVAAAGHAVGSHTWCHQDLSKTKGKCLINGKVQAVEYDPKEEIEKGISAVRWAVGGPTAPYFRFPALRQPPELITYLGQRNIAIFSTDFDSFDFKMRKPEQVRQAVMAKLKKHGKGIALMHDFQHATADAAAGLLADLKAGGYKIVFMKPKEPVKTIASYDEVIAKALKASTGGAADRPTSSVVRTINE
jgi:peptidoglycan/xylan/chitin deacetylase (PgdA/CDA1 family)